MPQASLAALAELKIRILRNSIALGLRKHQWRIAVGVVVVGLLCGSLYAILVALLTWLQQRHLESVLAVEYIFHFFFITVMVMLWISAALLNYAGLFGKAEPAYLLVGPVAPWQIVSVKFVEAFVLSSWSLFLLGVPLLAAMAKVYLLGVWFYPLFIAGFVALAVIPSAWGLLGAYVVARWLPRRAVGLAVLAAAGCGVVGLWIAAHRLFGRSVDYAGWLEDFYTKLRIARATFLPSTWMSRVTLEAGQGRYREALFYLAILAANAVFFAWLAVRVVARDFGPALMRASEASTRRPRFGGWLTAALTRMGFFWLPERLRVMVCKDLRCFLRDPSQWSQLAILGGLLFLYVLNLPRLNVRVLGEYAPVVVPLLNLSAISLILATFTGRFVFPQVSLESPQLWLLGTLPIGRWWIVISKFASAVAVTLVTACAVVGLSGWMLRMEPFWAVVQLLLAAAMCVGLCGLAVGMGAWMPNFDQASAAKIASGLGGMLNLIASVAWVAVVDTINAALCIRAFGTAGGAASVKPFAVAAVVVIWIAGIALAAGVLWAGARALSRRDL